MKTTSLLASILVTARLLAPGSSWGQGYTFSTIAGVPGQAGREDGTNSGALFSSPAGLAMDAQGNLYVSEDGNHTIRKLTPVGSDWVVTTIAGKPGEAGSVDGTNSQARFYRPRGLAVDSSGTIFVCDSYNSTMRRMDQFGPDWVVSTVAGAVGVQEHQDGSYTNALFRRPSGVTIGAGGLVYVADMNNHVIRQMEYLEPEWYVSTIAGLPFVTGSMDGTGAAAEFGTPYSLVAVKGGTLFVADTGNNAIREVLVDAGEGVVTTIAGALGAPAGSADGLGTEALFNYPVGIAASGAGTLFVTDQQNHTIRMLTQADGIWSVRTIGGSPMSAGTNNGPGTVARFQRPWGIAVDSGGNVYVADTRNHTIRKGVPGAVPGAAKLSVMQDVEGIVVTWPVSATGYQLQTRPTLDVAGVWTDVTESVVAGPDTFTVRMGNAGPAAFFRLRKQ